MGFLDKPARRVTGKYSDEESLKRKHQRQASIIRKFLSDPDAKCANCGEMFRAKGRSGLLRYKRVVCSGCTQVHPDDVVISSTEVHSQSEATDPKRSAEE